MSDLETLFYPSQKLEPSNLFVSLLIPTSLILYKVRHCYIVLRNLITQWLFNYLLTLGLLNIDYTRAYILSRFAIN